MRVVGKLGKVEETYPIILFGGDVVTEVLFEHAIDSFGLIVCLRVEGGGEAELCPE